VPSGLSAVTRPVSLSFLTRIKQNRIQQNFQVFCYILFPRFGMRRRLPNNESGSARDQGGKAVPSEHLHWEYEQEFGHDFQVCH